MGGVSSEETVSGDSMLMCVQASQRCAGGISEALEHFKLISQ